METLLEFVKVLGLGVIILFLLTVAYSIIQTFLDNIKSRKEEQKLLDLYEQSLLEILDEIEEEQKNKKATKKPRKTKKDE